MSFHLDSTVEELDFYVFNIEVSKLVREVSRAFDRNPKLPGVILLENDRLVGLISRTNFLQYMSRPYSLEIASKRPIKSLLSFMKVGSFIIDRNLLVIEAAKKSLEREPELMNEPIIIEIAPGKYGIIDAHDLLVYQAKIHEYTCELLTQMYGEVDVANRKLEKANRKLKYLSRVDDLTKVANRRVFYQYLEREWQRGQQQKMPVAVIICSLDYFREYNDRYGALAGDDCLQKVAETLKNCLEKKEDLVARYDGATFGILMPNTDAIVADIWAEKIRQQIIELGIEHLSSQKSDRLTLTVGVASMLPSLYNSPKDLTTAANCALDRAKQQGRNCKVIWNNSEKILAS